MTFDDFTKEYLNKIYVGGKMYLDKNDLRAAWNAAVDACMIQSCRNIGVALALRTDLEALKTPQEGSNDSAVRYTYP